MFEPKATAPHLDSTKRITRRRELLVSRPWNKITKTHDILLDIQLVDSRTLPLSARNVIRRVAA